MSPLTFFKDINANYPSQERAILPAARTTLHQVVQICLRRKLPAPALKGGYFVVYRNFIDINVLSYTKITRLIVQNISYFPSKINWRRSQSNLISLLN